ncbi:MAG TPA: arginine--tRNA ligase [Vicinamibacterales bacterium]|nr:arginine--tRNA ligase [Vicinamibacterales bacterium]
MILPIHDALRAALRDALHRLYDLDAATMPAIAVETPPNRSMGDLAVPVAFELARRLRKAPRAIAQEIAAAVARPEGVEKVAAAPNGYVNFFLDRARFLARELAGTSPQAHRADGKAIVEHTAINPNKAAHIGHLRNSALGDTLVRLLRFRGIAVEVQNYIDDTGVQVADVVVGFRELERRTLEQVRQVAETTHFDYYCWDLYARVTEWYEQDKTRLQIRARTLHDVERGGNENADMAAFVADRIVRAHLKTLARMNVEYDLLTWEGDILRLRFWAQAFEVLKAKGAVYLQTEGRLAGCWVMPIQDETDEDAVTEDEIEADAAVPDGEEEVGAAADSKEKVIVRSDGTVTYVGKDIAYQFWKLGVLGKDFYYRVYEERGEGRPPLWATSSTPGHDDARRPHFGGASMTFNVIDTRQSYLQKLLKQALAAMGYVREAENSTHFSYEMVALSHATARDLGYEPDDSGKPFVDVSGRKGLGVKADDLLDRLYDKALGEVEKRNPDLPDEERRDTARSIATAAVRYFLLKYSLSKMIIFDIGEALSFEGETGPYLQYAVVRAKNIFGKLQDRERISEEDVIASLGATDTAPLTDGDDADTLWGLALEAARLDEVVEQAVRTLEPATLAKYAFGLAQAFNAFYHRYPILQEERLEYKRWRAAVLAQVRRQLTTALDLMGFAVPSRM